MKINHNGQNTAFLLVNIHVSIELYALIFPEKEAFNSNFFLNSNNPLLKSQLFFLLQYVVTTFFPENVNIFASISYRKIQSEGSAVIHGIFFRVLTVIWVGTVKTHQTSEL